MVTIYRLKPAFQQLLRPAAAWLAAHRVRANHVTVTACVLSFAAGAAICWKPQARWPLFVLPAWLFARMALNAIDGIMAREHGQASRIGAFLNELGDVFADAALYLPFALLRGVSVPLVVAVVVLAVVVELTGAVAVQIGAGRRCDGPLGKSDRAFAFGALALLYAGGVPPGAWLDGYFWVLIALSVLTIANRIELALEEVRR